MSSFNYYFCLHFQNVLFNSKAVNLSCITWLSITPKSALHCGQKDLSDLIFKSPGQYSLSHTLSTLLPWVLQETLHYLMPFRAVFSVQLTVVLSL